jgi:hypothetical protein
VNAIFEESPVSSSWSRQGYSPSMQLPPQPARRCLRTSARRRRFHRSSRRSTWRARASGSGSAGPGSILASSWTVPATRLSPTRATTPQTMSTPCEESDDGPTAGTLPTADTSGGQGSAAGPNLGVVILTALSLAGLAGAWILFFASRRRSSQAR